jgi:hypothetical protein
MKNKSYSFTKKGPGRAHMKGEGHSARRRSVEPVIVKEERKALYMNASERRRRGISSEDMLRANGIAI